VIDFPSSPTFRKHAENLRVIVSTLTQVERAHKRAIRDSDSASEMAMRVVHTLLLGVFAEAQLRKILEDPSGFNDRERRLIWLEKSQEKRWLAAVDFATRRHYEVMTHQELNDVVAKDALERVAAVSRLLQGDLAPVITDRNRLAHGQWIHQLKSRSEDSFVVNSTTFDYNFVALRARKRLLDSIARLVNVLAVSGPTFDRDFGGLVVKIDEAKADLDGAGYAAFAAQLRRTKRPVSD
jgi:hypothetical protein